MAQRKAPMELKELHLNPHFIYLIEQDQQVHGQFKLELRKDGHRICQITDIVKQPPDQLQKYPHLEFDDVSIEFDLDALFQGSQEATCELHLKHRKPEGLWERFEQFSVRVNSYNFGTEVDSRLSSQRREHSIGKIKQLIFHYSFVGVYKRQGNIFDEGQQVVLQDIPLTKKDSKYGKLTHSRRLSRYDSNSIPLPTLGKKKSSAMMERTSVISGLELVEQYHREGERSLLRATFGSDISHPSLIQQLRDQSKGWLSVLLMVVGGGLIYYLMHPHSRA